MTKTYFYLYGVASDLSYNGTEKQQSFMREKVNPKLNKAKRMLIVYDEGVAQWQKIGTPYDAAKQEKEIRELFDDSIQALISIGVKVEK